MRVNIHTADGGKEPRRNSLRERRSQRARATPHLYREASAPNDIIWQSRLIGADTFTSRVNLLGGVYIFVESGWRLAEAQWSQVMGSSPREQAEYENN